MEKKKIIIFMLCTLLILLIIRFMSSCSFLTSDSSSPKTYTTIQEFEKEKEISVYNFYDLEEFIIYNRETPLKISPNPISISMESNKKDEKDYGIESQKSNSFAHYQVMHNSFKDNTQDMKSDTLKNGILYQRHFNDDSLYGRYFVGIFVKDDFYYQVGFTNNDLSVSEAEQKMIDYIKLVENID